MKKALLLTDGSIDMALSLRQWLETSAEPIDLTVVYALSTTQLTSQPLKAAPYYEAKKVANERLNRWLTFLPQNDRLHPDPSQKHQLHTEILLGEPELVLTIHLLIRRYDYLLVDPVQPEVISTFEACQSQIMTQLKWICLSERLGPPLVSTAEVVYTYSV
ncbi:hypothetical protein GCM10028805_16030 [Spirosoma harenae]